MNKNKLIDRGAKMNEFFSLNDTLYSIVEKYPETLGFFVTNGFEQLKNNKMLETMGKTITLEMALKSRKINPK